MQYAVRHITHFRYDAPIRESLMEVRMCPRTDARQQCYAFDLTLEPAGRLYAYRDADSNVVHHFSVPGVHEELRLEAESIVEVRPVPDLPEALPDDSWEHLEALAYDGLLEMAIPSRFACPTKQLRRFMEEHGITRMSDPLTQMRKLNTLVYEAFAYDGRSTHANSPIDDALAAREGVCQDFAHIFIAIARELGVPCRYVSGYLFHRTDYDRSAEDGSHAWVEAYLPDLGWVGFDPTNDILAEERHIRVALGRDYADVPPSRGVFKGQAGSDLRVGVQVIPVDDDTERELALDIEDPTLAHVVQELAEEEAAAAEAQRGAQQ